MFLRSIKAKRLAKMIQRPCSLLSLILLVWIFGCESSDYNHKATSDDRRNSGSTGRVGVTCVGGWLGGVAGSGPFQSEGSGGVSADAGFTRDAEPDDSSNTTDADTATGLVEDCSLVSEIAVDILKKDIFLEGQTVSKTVQTVLAVSWAQDIQSDSVRLRFTFENDQWFESPKKPGTRGSHRELVLGVPEKTDVTIQIVSQTANGEVACQTQGTTGKVPRSVPRATILDCRPELMSRNRWMIGSVEDTPRLNSRYVGPFIIYIIDRQGRIVWYYLDQAWNPAMTYPRIPSDGTHLVVDRSLRNGINHPSVFKTTLDFEYFEEFSTPEMIDSMDVTDDGSILYNSYQWLIEQRPGGTTRNIWNCQRWAAATGAREIDSQYCYSNAVAWNRRGDSVLLSFPYVNTVVEIDRRTGDLVGQWGELPGSWTMDPPTRRLDFVHGGNITPDGTLLVSSHEPGSGESYDPVPHFFFEFELDRVNRIATEVWMFGESVDEWPRWKGEAYRVTGGNTLVNYGSGGSIWEVTPDGQTAWNVKWDADFPNDYINKMVGHSILINDLYALCEGW
jgi:hypothetical protein